MAKHWCNAVLKKLEILTAPEPLHEKQEAGPVFREKFQNLYKYYQNTYPLYDKAGSLCKIGVLPSLKNQYLKKFSRMGHQEPVSFGGSP
jgi:hypothetical protein